MKFKLSYFIGLIPMTFFLLPKSNYDKNYITYNTTYEEVEKILVYVSGEVLQTGTYYMNKGSMVRDLIRKCGLTDFTTVVDMDIKQLLIHGACYHFTKAIDNENEKVIGLNISSYIPSTNGTIIIESSNSKEESSTKININLASASVLTKLEGIGNVIANRIIEYRNLHLFSSIEEIKNVSGIGDDIYDKIKNKISI